VWDDAEDGGDKERVFGWPPKRTNICEDVVRVGVHKGKRNFGIVDRESIQ